MSKRSNPSAGNASGDKAPWWSYGHVWLVLAGPAIVVVAGFVTFYIAVKTNDTLVDEDYYRKGLALSRPAAPATPSLAPSLTARNHAQTGTPQAAPMNKEPRTP